MNTLKVLLNMNINLYNVKSDELVKSFIKYEYKPKKVKSPLTNFIVYDLETYNKDRAIP